MIPYALLYRSVATHPIGDLSMRALSVRSAQRNAHAGITGLLLHGRHSHVSEAPGAFVQWLEGPEDEVRELFNRIESDDRHRDVEVLASGCDLSGRGAPLFPDWDLGVEFMADLPATLGGFLDYVDRQRQSAEGVWAQAA